MPRPLTHLPDLPSREPLTVLDEGAFLRWALTSVGYLAERQQHLNDLNVFPVPDGDTGTNLLRTLSSALEAALSDPSLRQRPMPDRIDEVARGALLWARGNSGVILSQILVGLAEGLGRALDEASSGKPAADVRVGPRELAFALRAAADRGREGVHEPVEGTILSVADAGAAAGEAAAAAGGTLGKVVAAVTRGAAEALDATTWQLEELREAGVVDAGGAGLLLILRALDDVVHGVRHGPTDLDPLTSGHLVDTCDAPTPPSPGTVTYEVVYHLKNVTAEGLTGLATELNLLGDSVAVGGSASWGGYRELATVHVHTDRPGEAIEKGYAVGRPTGIRIELLTGVDGDGMEREHAARGSVGESSVDQGRFEPAGLGKDGSPGGSGKDGSAQERMDPHREDEDEANAAVVLPDGFGSAEPLERLAVVVSARGPELVKLFEQCGAHVVRPPYAALAGQAAPSSTTTPTNTTNPTPTTTTSNDAAPNGAAGGNGSASEAASKHSAEDNAAPTHFASDQAGSNTVSPNVSGETAEPDETVDDENLRAVVETIEACRSARARVVLVLPGDPLMAALSDALREHAARELAPHGIELIVADTRHPVQALAAVTVLDESANPRTEANRLAEAARAVLTGEVRQAIRRVTYAAGAVRAGDYFGYCTDDVRFTGRDACEVAGRLVAELAERTEDGPELITLVGGRGYTSIVEQMTEQLQQRYPEAEIVTVTGGAPGVVAAVGVE